MSRILGLDLGTNSIGWAIVDRNGSDFSLIEKGVRIFAEGVKIEKGIESSKAAERTGYRSARKTKFRRKLRKYETLKVLSKNGMCPLSIEEVEEWRKSNFKQYPINPEFLKWLRTDDDKGINPYAIRDKVSKHKSSLYELGRALYHIAQRRGFLSNRLDQSADGIIEQHAPAIETIIEEAQTVTDLSFELNDYFNGLDVLNKNSKELDEGEKKLKTLYNAMERIIKSNDFEKAKVELTARLNRKEDLGAVKQEIGEISKNIEEGTHTTLGQYFNSLYNRSKIRNYYTSREVHYLSEFEIICKAQGIGEINEDEKVQEKRYSGLAKLLYKAIFFQRPLKSQKKLIGKCSLEKSKTRCAISHPDFEEYRMWAYLNTIKIKTPTDDKLRFLTSEERLKLVPKFFRKKDNFYFEDLARELISKKDSFDFYKFSNADYLFNYKSKDTVAGCVVSASLKNVFGDDWKSKHWAYQTRDKNGITVTRNINYKDIWHLLSVSTSDIYLEEFALNKLGLDEKRAKLFSKIRLKKDFANLSLNAINKIIPYLKQGLSYSHAVFMANIENVVDQHIWNNPKERLLIQNKIAELINKNAYENSKLEIINSLIKACKVNNWFYSKEAESTYKADVRKKVKSVFKDIEDQEAVVNELFSLFIEQLQKYEYMTFKRLDEKVLEFLKGENQDGEIYCSDYKRLNKIYHPSDIEIFKKKIVRDEFNNETVVLGSPLIPSIRNPMATRALHQLRNVLNALIIEGSIDTKTNVHIELARELNDANKRKAIQDFQNENKKKRGDFRKEIKALYLAECKREIEPTEDDMLRYQLWIEQDKKEIYEEGRNISICDIIGENPKYDIEHTIPRSISQDNSLMNKTLCSQRYNRDVKKNKMPVELPNHEVILLRVDNWRKEADKLTREIEQIVKSTRNAATKEAKDKKIRRRHYLTLKRDYLKGKYQRFVWTEPKQGFKNSQIPDTGVITKYARAYLKSYFDRVESVKGGMVAEFRKIWGLQPSYIRDDKKYYEDKDRSKHTHHTIDAITIACMTKDKYDMMANAWDLEDDVEKANYKTIKELFEKSKPWKTFTEDLKKIECEILVSHHTADNLKIQSKKIVRVKGKKQFVAEVDYDLNGKASAKKDAKGKIIYKLNDNGERIPRFQRGDTVRGSLHQDTIYGAIKDPLNTKEIRYVIRKDIESIKSSDVENIVDEKIKSIIKIAVRDKILVISSNAQQKNKLAENKKVWMNEEKNIPINKVRIYANSVKNPLAIKEHSALSKSKHDHKQKIYGQNDENFALAIYEGLDKKGKIKRVFESINNKDAGQYFKLSNRQLSQDYDIVSDPHYKENLPLKYILKKGLMVLFYKESPSEVYELDEKDLSKRLYKLSKFDAQGRLSFRTHFEARAASELKEIYSVDFEKPFEQIRLQVSKLNMLVEGYEFNMKSSGKIIFN